MNTSKIAATWFALPLVSAALAQTTELYVVDIGPNRNAPWQVVKYDASGENPEVFIGSGLNKPQDILFLEDRGVALVSNFGSNRITRHDAETGAFLSNFATGITGPTRIVIGADGLLYVLQWNGSGLVLRYRLDGSFVDTFTSVGVTNSIGIDWDDEGNMYVASFNAAHVRKFDPNGNDMGLFVTTNLVGPTNIWFDDSGDLMVMDWSGRAIRRYDENGTFVSNFVLGLNEPEGVEFLANGDILVGNGGTSSVRQYDRAGNFIGDLVPPRRGGLVKPNGLRLRTIGSGFTINAGLTGAWANFATLGQGFVLEVLPESSSIFLAWFTWESGPAGVSGGKIGDPGHRWLTALGSYHGDSADLEVTLTTGGQFDDPAMVDNQGYGMIGLTFADCENATLVYSLPDIGLTGTIPLQRIASDNVAFCQSLVTR